MKILAVITRALYLLVGLFFLYMERAANWVIGYNSKTQYIRKGACRKCGKCCQVLGIEYPNFFNRIPWIFRPTIKWHEFRYGFTYLNSEGNYFLYKCNFVTPEGRCSVYRFRPRLCREYPKLRLYGKSPTHFDCGFYFVPRDGRSSFEEALHKAAETNSTS